MQYNNLNNVIILTVVRQYVLYFIYEYLLVFFLELVFDLIFQKDKERLNVVKFRVEGIIDVQSFSNIEKDFFDFYIYISQFISVFFVVFVMESIVGIQFFLMVIIKEFLKLGILQLFYIGRGVVFSLFVKDFEK